MKIMAAANQGFSLELNDGLCRSSVWRLYADSPDTPPGFFADEVSAWCGSTGDDLRIPSADGSPVPLTDFPVEKIEAKSLSLLAYEVVFHSKRIDTEPAFSEIRSADGRRRKKAGYTVKSAAPESILPAPGAVLDWQGEIFYCESASFSPAGQGMWTFEVTGVPSAGMMSTIPAVNVDSGGTRTVSCTWCATADEYDTLMAVLEVDSPALWAGEGFAVRSVVSRSEGVSSILVTATAGEVQTRMLKCTRSEKFAGFDDDGTPLRSIIYESLWRVRSEDMENFTGITGTAASWAGEDAVVSSVVPEKISSLEYQLTIKAEPLENPDLYERYSGEGRSNLQDRNEVSARMTEFMLTPEMAGWRSGFDGVLEMCPDWQHGANCPFEVTGNMPEALVDRALKCALLEVTEYFRGGMSRNIDRLLEWSSSDRVFHGEVGGCDGSYLRVDMEADEVFDNQGRRWTRFTGSWQRAPDGYRWNGTYWGKV